MINTNKYIKKGRAHGILCGGISIKLKKNEQLNWKNWDGIKVIYGGSTSMTTPVFQDKLDS